MFRFLQRATCQHVWTWSERRQAERCYRCRATRKAAAPEILTSRFEAAAAASEPEPEPELKPQPPEFLLFSPGTDEAAPHFHTDRLHHRLVTERPVAATTAPPGA